MQYEDVTLQLNGGLDTRSADGSCGNQWFRLLLNVDGSEPFTLCCLGGWQRRMYSSDCQNNQDLHDQMTEAQFYSEEYSTTYAGYTAQVGVAFPDIPIYQDFPAVTQELCRGLYYLNNTCREHLTWAKSVTSTSGSRRLMVGTHSRIYVSDDRGGNWRIIADGLGGACSSSSKCDCSPIRLTGASLGNYTVMTNGVDEVLYWLFDSGPAGCYSWSADYVPELRQLNLTRAAGVVEFQGLLFLWDVRMDNLDFPGRILWSDFNAPLSWIPGGESIAGFNDFSAGEKIIAAVPISGRLRVYTNQAIYDGTIVQDSRVVAFTERYRLKGGTTSNLPAFRNGIANCGDFHIYVGQDDIFRMAEYDTAPVAMDWLHRASGVIFQGLPERWLCGTENSEARSRINRSACDSLIARWSGRYKCVIISWPTGTSRCPDTSLWLWPDTFKATVVDYGFTEVVEHQPDDGESWRDFFGRMGVCDPAADLVDKEGQTCPQTFVEVEYTGLWNATEDTSLPMDPNSVAALFCDLCMDDLCRLCESDTALVLASASDKTLKEYTQDQYVREELVETTDRDFPESDLGVYQEQGYRMLIQGDSEQRFGPTEKLFRNINVGWSLGDSTDRPTLCASVGGGYSSSCLQWEKQGMMLECGDPGGRRRAGKPTTFGFYTEGVWLAWRLSIPASPFCGNLLTLRFETGGCW